MPSEPNAFAGLEDANTSRVWGIRDHSEAAPRDGPCNEGILQFGTNSFHE